MIDEHRKKSDQKVVLASRHPIAPKAVRRLTSKESPPRLPPTISCLPLKLCSMSKRWQTTSASCSGQS